MWMAGSYKTAGIERRRQVHRDKVGEVEPRNGKPSNKCECDAKMIVHHHIDNTVSVEYHWQHTNHGKMQADTLFHSLIAPVC